MSGDRALSNLTFTTDMNDLADRQLVIEAVVEDEAVKAAIFAELDRVVTIPPRCWPPTPPASRS
ncbi:3-hydroxyacyl-CoA dehydrogenase, NAD binding domain protein [Mycobacterium kansasii 662]|uniref:3-hydroxyacyl-CoA dehydrogenase, NAD binding domain protein n=1 Tax=Mycobacterium kansasii 662 TaxID=1299326 RepID=X7XTZ0_MYCKA|nr:3-hydroxyacyl-CoA dehydrogenase, NAD binding domain protein [Mycobacterium kansasii 662]